MEDQVTDGRSDFRLHRLHSDLQQLKGRGAGIGWCVDNCPPLICFPELGGLILGASVMEKKSNGYSFFPGANGGALGKKPKLFAHLVTWAFVESSLERAELV